MSIGFLYNYSIECNVNIPSIPSGYNKMIIIIMIIIFIIGIIIILIYIYRYMLTLNLNRYASHVLVLYESEFPIYMLYICVSC